MGGISSWDRRRHAGSTARQTIIATLCPRQRGQYYRVKKLMMLFGCAVACFFPSLLLFSTTDLSLTLEPETVLQLDLGVSRHEEILQPKPLAFSAGPKTYGHASTPTGRQLYPSLPILKKSRHNINHNNISRIIIDPQDRMLMPDLTWDNSPIVMEDLKLLFVTTPKIGTTVFKQLFRRLQNFTDWMVDDGEHLPHDPHGNGLVYLYDFSMDRVQDILTNPSWTRAIFTRDPMERLVSAYLDKGARENGRYIKAHCCGITRGKRKQVIYAKQERIRQHLEHHQQQRMSTNYESSTIGTLSGPASENKRSMTRRRLQSPPTTRPSPKGVRRGMSLPAVCDTLHNESSPVLWEVFVLDILPFCVEDEHWRPQVVSSDTASSSLQWINFVGRFDQLALDTRRLLERVGAWEPYGASGWSGGAIFDHNAARHKTSSSSRQNIAMYYRNQTILDAVWNLYRADYEHPLLNHSLPVFVQSTRA